MTAGASQAVRDKADLLAQSDPVSFVREKANAARALVAAEPGFYPWGIAGPNDRGESERRGTEILVLKDRPGDLRFHIDCGHRGLTGGDTHPTGLWVLDPSGLEIGDASLDRTGSPTTSRCTCASKRNLPMR